MRLFIATTFPDAVTRELNARVSAVKPRLPPASWVRAEAQHLTFAFLGEQDETLVARLAPELETALAKVPKFEARVRGCGFFPNSRRARVGWAGLDPETRFAEVARVVREVVSRNGVELDGGEFRPHLTLCRIRDSWPPASIDTFERALREHQSQPFQVEKVTLYSSQLNPNGAIHTPLRQFPLA